MTANPPRTTPDPQDKFYDTLEKSLKAQTAAQHLKMATGGGSDLNVAQQVGEIAKSFGFDIGRMQEKADEQIRAVADAKTETAKAELQGELAKMQGAIDLAKQKDHDPIRDIGLDMIRKKLDGSDDPTNNMWREYFAKKTIEMMDRGDNPPSLVEQLTEDMERLKLLTDIGSRLNPTATLDADKQLQVDKARLEYQKEVDMYDIDKKNEQTDRRNQNLVQIIEMGAKALGSIGAALFDRMTAQANAAPGQLTIAGAPAPENLTNDVATMACPDCNKTGIQLTAAMQARVQSGAAVETVCVECGAQHTISRDEAEAEQASDFGESEIEEVGAAWEAREPWEEGPDNQQQQPALQSETYLERRDRERQEAAAIREARTSVNGRPIPRFSVQVR